MPAVPFKANADRRHHIPKQQHRVTNWAGYDAALRQRGGLTVWFTDDAIAGWRAEPRTTPGRQPVSVLKNDWRFIFTAASGEASALALVGFRACAR